MADAVDAPSLSDVEQQLPYAMTVVRPQNAEKVANSHDAIQTNFLLKSHTGMKDVRYYSMITAEMTERGRAFAHSVEEGEWIYSRLLFAIRWAKRGFLTRLKIPQIS